MAPASEAFKPEHTELLKQISKGWGWTNPPPQVIEIAEESRRLKTMRVGEVLVQLKALSDSQLNQLLAEKGNNDLKFLEFAAEKFPEVRKLIDRILTTKAGFPYYDYFEGLFDLHPLMADAAVARACHDMDSILLLSVENFPVIAFSTHQKLMEYNTAGRELRSKDPIRKALITFTNTDNFVLYVATGDRSEIIGSIGKSRKHEATEEVAPSESIWNSTQADTEAKKILARLLDSCMEKSVTDMAITPLRTGGASTRMRRFGDMMKMDIPFLKESEYRPILNFLGVRSGANPKSARKFVPTDGHLTYRSGSGDVFLRLSFMPMNHPGTDVDMQSISIRFFPRTETDIQLVNLKLQPDVVKAISTAARFRNGLILLCGGTNTGKSTTIAGALGENIKHHGDKLKRVSFEQPIERYLKGVDQFNILESIMKDEEKVEGFGLYLRALKRHDPDVIWVGEIRDQESANVCVASSITGHLVFSTIHANNTLLGYDNLSKMVHVDHRYQFVEALSLIVAQDLVKKVCVHCGTINSPTEFERDMFKAAIRKHNHKGAELPSTVIHAKEGGCDECGHTGYEGVLPINEVLECTWEVKNAMLDMLSNGSLASSRQILEEARSITLFKSAMDLVCAHQIEVESIVI